MRYHKVHVFIIYLGLCWYELLNTHKWTEWMTPSWACRDSWQWGTCWGRCPGGWSSPGRPAPSVTRGDGGWGQHYYSLLNVFTECLNCFEPPSPRTSSPSDMSSVACGQSGHTTPMEDSDKRKCTFNFYSNLIWSERMKKQQPKVV